MRPSLDHSVSVADANGREYTWSQDERDSWSIPASLNFATRRDDGYAECSLTLQRPITRDFPDLGLLNEITVVANDGTVVYNGRVTAFPRTSSPSGGEFFNVTATGFLSHAADRTFTEVYVDRDLSRWGEPSNTRKATLLVTAAPEYPSATVDAGQAVLASSIGPKSGVVVAGLSEGMYGGQTPIGSIYYAWTKSGNTSAADANWFWEVRLCADEVQSALDVSGDLRAAGPGTGTVTATGTKTHAFVEFFYETADELNETYMISWTCLANYGTHGLTKQGTEDATTAKGFYASDVIRDIASRFAPLLDTSEVQDTSYVINQLAFHDPITPFDAMAQLNAFHQYELQVWEDRKLHFTQPTPLDDWDWEIRLEDAGTQATLQGDSIEDLANGIVVRFTDLITGKEVVLTPETHTELASTSEYNPATLRGIDRWTEVSIPYATLTADALQIGRAALGEFSRAKAPGEFTVGGHIRDRNGNWQAGSRVRAGQRVVVSDHPNDSSRRITETQWNDVDKTLRITTDNKTQRLEGWFARTQQGRTARGL